MISLIMNNIAEKILDHDSILKIEAQRHKKNEKQLFTIGYEGISLEEYINKMNLNKYCTFTSSLARGQDYYTGNVFEVYEKNRLISGAIGGGGRYDKMITEFINDGEIYPAVGISFGLTSIFELLKNREEFASSSPVDIYIIPMGTNIVSILATISQFKFLQRLCKTEIPFCPTTKSLLLIPLAE